MIIGLVPKLSRRVREREIAAAGTAWMLPLAAARAEIKSMDTRVEALC